MFEELGQSQRISFRVTPILFDSTQHVVGLSLAQEALFSSLVGKVEDDEPSADSDNASQHALEDEDPLPTANTTYALHLHDAVGEDVGDATDADRDEVESAQAVLKSE